MPHLRRERLASCASARRIAGGRRSRPRDPGRGDEGMNRAQRHAAILRLVGDRPLGTQTELAEALRSEGHEVVQTTVSRDIHELGLIKIRHESGRLVYAPPRAAEAGMNEALSVALGRWALSIEPSGNLAVVTTPHGYASALAEAIDVGHHPRFDQ